MGPRPDRPEDQLVPATRYAIGDRVFGMEAYPGREGQLDLVPWVERIGAVVAGDTLIDLGGRLEIPATWLPEGVTVEQVAAGLRPLLDKSVEFVLPTHGEPTPAPRPPTIPFEGAGFHEPQAMDLNFCASASPLAA